MKFASSPELSVAHLNTFLEALTDGVRESKLLSEHKEKFLCDLAMAICPISMPDMSDLPKLDTVGQRLPATLQELKDTAQHIGGQIRDYTPNEAMADAVDIEARRIVASAVSATEKAMGTARRSRRG